MIWKGKARVGNYAVCGFQGKTQLVHRVSHFFATGQTPPIVRHTCDTPLCVEPSHLVGGNRRDNMDDMMARGRQQQGATHWNAKLTEEQVADIRRRVVNGEMQKDVAEAFGMSHQQISKIVRNDRWKEPD